ncbi:eukaryotic porin/Tom40 [Lipomyces oligophaga]|uniref:eukaryotic porin/Tom40 n=1 Tax=Lipomyces oligophaga TaxID=45792 RepID=UPI0034CFE30B
MSYGDIAKKPNDLLNRDFFHLAPAALSVKTKADNGVTFTVSGKSSPKDGSISGNLEAKYVDSKTGVTLTQGWTTANSISTKFELPAFVPSLKTDFATTFLPSAGTKGAVVTLNYRQFPVVSKVVVDLLKGPTFAADFAFAKAGAIAGGEVNYDVPAGSVKNYTAAVGYGAGTYALFVSAASKLSVFSAGYYTKPSPQVEVAAKATWDSKSTAVVGFELGTKYTIDADTSAKIKIANSGLVSLSYLQTIHPGVKLGLGAAVDTQRLNEPAHKLGLSFSFEA